MTMRLGMGRRVSGEQSATVVITVRIIDEANMAENYREKCSPNRNEFLFCTGRLQYGPGVVETLTDEQVLVGLARHVRGDWGLVGRENWRANDTALKQRGRLASEFCVEGQRFLIVTEIDRSRTIILLPEGAPAPLAAQAL